MLLPVFERRYWYGKLSKLPPRYLRNLTFALNRTLPFDLQYSNYAISNAEPTQLITTLLNHLDWLTTANIKKHAQTTPGGALQLTPGGISANIHELNQTQLRNLASVLNAPNTQPKVAGKNPRWGKLKLRSAVKQAMYESPKAQILHRLNRLTYSQLHELAGDGHEDDTREQIIEHLMLEEQWAIV